MNVPKVASQEAEPNSPWAIAAAPREWAKQPELTETPSRASSRSNSPESDKTDKTSEVSNEEFLGAVFHTDLQDAAPVVVTFAGDPSTATKGAWQGRPWRPAAAGQLTAVASNNYFSLAAFRPDEAGRFRRRKAAFQSLHAVMLDDIGTKVPTERLTLEPSWLLETSPGNFQAGYILQVPEPSARKADALMNAIVAAKLCDPGANGPTARLARLPVAVNGKHSPAFKCRLVRWEPTCRYTIEKLMTGLQVDPSIGKRRKEGSRTHEAAANVDLDAIWIPRPNENAVLSNLRQKNLYKTPLGEGKHDVTCPWTAEHTNGVDTGAAYFEPDDNWPIGGFKCLHGHCGNRHIRDLLAFLGVDVCAARMKPTIRILPGELHRIVDAAERELAQVGKHYQRGGLIVSVVTDPGTRETRVQPVSQSALVRALAGAATWERFDGRSGEWVRSDPPARHAAVLFDSNGYHHLKVLGGLARHPYLRTDGSLATTAGYDVATGMFGVFDARKYSVPDSPTRSDAESALAVLSELLEEFSFASEVDRAAALSAMLTATVRQSLPHAPMFHVRAHVVGSGKSYLCALVGAFSTPQRGSPTTFPTSEDECRKVLFSDLLRAPAVIEFDNLTGDILPHNSLCTALTSEFMSERILGVSKTASVSTRTLFLSSGNNVGPIQDMVRRCVTINLSPQCETPASRSFKHAELVPDVLSQRHRYVSAALTILRAWIVAGRPVAKVRAMAGFRDWSEMCRQPLLWLGLPDPAESVFLGLSEDPSRLTLGRFLSAWHTMFENKPAMVREAVLKANESSVQAGALNEVLVEIAGERDGINRKKLGWWIRRHAGAICEGRRIVRGDGRRSAEQWQVEVVSSVS